MSDSMDLTQFLDCLDDVGIPYEVHPEHGPIIWADQVNVDGAFIALGQHFGVTYGASTLTRDEAYARAVLATLGNTEPTAQHLRLCAVLLPVPADWKIGDAL